MDCLSPWPLSISLIDELTVISKHLKICYKPGSLGNMGVGGRREEKPGSIALWLQSEPSGGMTKLTKCHLKWSSYQRWHWCKVSWCWKQTRVVWKGWTWARSDLSGGCSYFDNILVKLSHLLKFCWRISCGKGHQTIWFSCIVYTGILLQWVISYQQQ